MLISTSTLELGAAIDYKDYHTYPIIFDVRKNIIISRGRYKYNRHKYKSRPAVERI